MPKHRSNARKGVVLTANTSVLGLKRFEVMSAVEGLKLSPKGRKRVATGQSPEKRRADVLKAYLDLKGPR
jgi:hypothetical protein